MAALCRMTLLACMVPQVRLKKRFASAKSGRRAEVPTDFAASTAPGAGLAGSRSSVLGRV